MSDAIFVPEGEYIIVPTGVEALPVHRHEHLKAVGGKACGLSLLPEQWTPPFFVISSEVYKRWAVSDFFAKSDLLLSVSTSVFEKCNSGWMDGWDRGLMIRSSSVQETLAERGAFETKELPADFDVDNINAALREIYCKFMRSGGGEDLAVVVQARVDVISRGHASNEKRLSPTENQWSWETDSLDEPPRRFNSQRATADPGQTLSLISLSEKGILGILKSVARWCTKLQQGRVHLEWGLSAHHLWIFQLDFEDDQPDLGHDPRAFLRNQDLMLPAGLRSDSILAPVDHNIETGWKKIDNTKFFVQFRTDKYPSLFYVSGERLAAVEFDTSVLIKELDGITRGRAVCRTDCNSPHVDRLNLPRIDSVSSDKAVEFMLEQLKNERFESAKPSEICFIVHRFIAANVAVWALVRPFQQIVVVDALWGLPDGLQYLDHDTFEYDVKRDGISAERIRYKPSFLQETESGDWKLIKVARGATRHRCLSKSDLREVAHQSRLIADIQKRPLQIMWFCDVDARLNIGRNVPWFMMNADDKGRSNRPQPVSPSGLTLTIRNLDDIEKARELIPGKCALQLSPDAEFFRDDEFIKKVAVVAKQMRFPVIMTGSVLSHAFYFLERENVSVITASSTRTRARQKQIFRKLVRDEIPRRIAERGERVVTAQIPKSEARTALVVKLLEESHELLAATSPQEVSGELVDLVEVVKALCSATGIDWDEVLEAAELKRSTRGSFNQNVVLMETSWPTFESGPNVGQAPLISLKELGQISKNGTTTDVSYAAVLAKGGDNVVTLHGGARVAVRMSGSGIGLDELDPIEEGGQGQLAFQFQRLQ